MKYLLLLIVLTFGCSEDHAPIHLPQPGDDCPYTMDDIPDIVECSHGVLIRNDKTPNQDTYFCADKDLNILYLAGYKDKQGFLRAAIGDYMISCTPPDAGNEEAYVFEVTRLEEENGRFSWVGL